MLPVGVVIPTRNSMAYLRAHVEGLRHWLDLAEEVVVVDSDSTDGTVEYLRKNLSHPKTRFLAHPPGLYASWNHGIAHVKAEFVYLATVGDTITREGITHLVQVAQDLNADVVISKPRFVKPNGREECIEWPIDDMVKRLHITQPRALSRMESLLFAIAHADAALTGSCASDLFRTTRLQTLPFPTEFGMAGDGAWGLRHACDVSWAVTPNRVSTFLRHPPQKRPEQITPQIAWDKLAQEMVGHVVVQGVVTQSELEAAQIPQVLRAFEAGLAAKRNFNQARAQAWPWILSPNAWKGREERNHLQQAIHGNLDLGLKASQNENPTQAIA